MKKVLLDENLPRRLKSHFTTKLDVTTVPDLGWQSKENGELLAAMTAEGISFLVTADKNLRFQQNLKKHGVSVVVVLTHDTRLGALVRVVTQIEDIILNAQEGGELVEVDLRK